MPTDKNPANKPSGKEAARATSTFWGCVLGFDKWNNYLNERGIVVPRGVILKWGDDPPPTIPPCTCSSSSSMSVHSHGSDNSFSPSASSESSSEFEESITISIGRPPLDPDHKDASKQRKESQEMKEHEKSKESDLGKHDPTSTENLKKNGRMKNSKESQLSSQETEESPNKRESTSKESVKMDGRKNENPKSAEKVQVYRVNEMTNQKFPREGLRSESPNYRKMRRASPNGLQPNRGHRMPRQDERVNMYKGRTRHPQDVTTPMNHSSPSYNLRRYEASPVSTRRRPSPILSTSRSVEMVVLNLDGTDYKTTQVFNCEGAVSDPPPSRCPKAGPRQVSHQLPPMTSPGRGCPNKTLGSGNAGGPDQYPMVDPNTGNKYVLIKVASGTRKHPEDISVILNDSPVRNDMQDESECRKYRGHQKKSDSEEEEDSEGVEVEDDTGAQKKHKKNKEQFDQGANSLPIYITKRRVKRHHETRERSERRDDSADETGGEPRGGRRHRSHRKLKDAEEGNNFESPNERKSSRNRSGNHNGGSHQRDHHSHSGNEGNRSEKTGPCRRCGRRDGKKQDETSGQGGASRKGGSGRPCRCCHAACQQELNASSRSEAGGVTDPGIGRGAEGGANGKFGGGAEETNKDNPAVSEESENDKTGDAEEGRNKKAGGDSSENNEIPDKNNSKEKAVESKKSDSSLQSKGSSFDVHESSLDSLRNGGDTPTHDRDANQSQENASGKPGKVTGAKKTGKKESGSSIKRETGSSNGNVLESESQIATSKKQSTAEKSEKIQRGRALTIDTRSSLSTDRDKDSDVRSELSLDLTKQRNASKEDTPKRSREKILKNTRIEASTSTTTLHDQMKNGVLKKSASTQTYFDENERVTFIGEQRDSETKSSIPATSDSSLDLDDKKKKFSQEKITSGTPTEINWKPIEISTSTQTDFDDHRIAHTSSVPDRMLMEPNDNLAESRLGEKPTTSDSPLELVDSVNDNNNKKKETLSEEKIVSGTLVEALAPSVQDQPKGKPIGITESTQTEFEDQGTLLNATDRAQIGNYDNSPDRLTPSDLSRDHELNEVDNSQSNAFEEDNNELVEKEIASKMNADTNEVSNGFSKKTAGKNKIFEKSSEKYVTTYNASSSVKHSDIRKLEPNREPVEKNDRKSDYGRLSAKTGMESEPNPIQTTDKVTANATLIITTPGNTEQDSCLNEERQFVIKPNVTMTDGTFVLTFKSCSCGEKTAAIRAPATQRLNEENAPLGRKGADRKKVRNLRSISDIVIDTSETGMEKTASEIESGSSPGGSVAKSHKRGPQKKSMVIEGGARTGSKDETSETEYLTSAFENAEAGDESKMEKEADRGKQVMPLGGKANKAGMPPTRQAGVEASRTKEEDQPSQMAVLDSGGERYRQQRRTCGDGGCRKRGGALYGVGVREKRKKEVTEKTKEEKNAGEPTEEDRNTGAKSRKDKSQRKGKTKAEGESEEKLDDDKQTKEEKNHMDDKLEEKKKNQLKGNSNVKIDKPDDEPREGDEKKEKNQLKRDSDVKIDKPDDEPREGDEKKEDSDQKANDDEDKKKKTRIDEGSKEKMKDDEDENNKDDKKNKNEKEKEDKRKKRYRRSSVESGASVRMVTAFNAHLVTQAAGRRKFAARKEASGVDHPFKTFWQSNVPAPNTDCQTSQPASTSPQGSLPPSTAPQESLQPSSQPPSTPCKIVLSPSTTSFPSCAILTTSSNSFPSPNVSCQRGLLSPNILGQTTIKTEPPRLNPARFLRNSPDTIERGVCDHELKSNPATLRVDSSHEDNRERILMSSHCSMADTASVSVASRYGSTKSNTNTSEAHRTNDLESSGMKGKGSQSDDHKLPTTMGGVVESLIMAVSTGMTPSLSYNDDIAPQISYSKITKILDDERRLAMNSTRDTLTNTKEKKREKEKGIKTRPKANLLNEEHEMHENCKEISLKPLATSNNNALVSSFNGLDLSKTSNKSSSKLHGVAKFERLTKTIPKVYVLKQMAEAEVSIQPPRLSNVMRVESADSVITAHAAGLRDSFLQTQRSASALVRHQEVGGSSAASSDASRLSKGCRFSDFDTALKGSFVLDVTEEAAALSKDQKSNGALPKSRREQNHQAAVRRLIRVAQTPQLQPGASSCSASSAESWLPGVGTIPESTLHTGGLKRKHRQDHEDVFKVRDTKSSTETLDDAQFSFSRYNNLENSTGCIALQKDMDTLRDKVITETQIDSKQKKGSKWMLLSFLGHGRLKPRSKPNLSLRNKSQDSISLSVGEGNAQSTSATSDCSDAQHPSESILALRQSSSTDVKRKSSR